MTLSRDFKHTVIERAQREPAFAKAMFDEAATLFLNGKPAAARLILRDLVNATVGFETLARKTNRPSKSLHRMLSSAGNPNMDNLAAIFGAVRKSLNKGPDTFIARGLASREKSKRSGIYISSGTVMKNLKSRLAKAKTGKSE